MSLNAVGTEEASSLLSARTDGRARSSKSAPVTNLTRCVDAAGSYASPISPPAAAHVHFVFLSTVHSMLKRCSASANGTPRSEILRQKHVVQHTSTRYQSEQHGYQQTRKSRRHSLRRREVR